MEKIKRVLIVGAGGKMGSQIAGLIAGYAGCRVSMMVRSREKGLEAIEKAVASVKSDAIRKNLRLCLFPSDLTKEISLSDWIIECLPEDYEVKKEIYVLISQHLKPHTIVSTNTSSLSVQKLSEIFPKNLRENFFGTHFFNPVLRMSLCELVLSSYSNKILAEKLFGFLQDILQRRVISLRDSPLFIANRIGFQFINEVLGFSKIYKNSGGEGYMENILGCHTGRVMPPLSTINFVGLSVAKEIVSNLNLNFKMKNNIIEWNGKIDSFSHDSVCILRFKELISLAKYGEAFTFIKKNKTNDAKIINHFMGKYVSDSFALIDEKMVSSIENVDLAMALGFNWAPPSYIIDLYGGVWPLIEILKKEGMLIPKALVDLTKKDNKNLFNLWKYFDPRSFFRV